MTQVRSGSPVSLGLTALIAFASALVALALSGGHDTPRRTASRRPPPTARRDELRVCAPAGNRVPGGSREWTRLGECISLTTDSPNTKATVARLLRNQSDIGNAIKPYYGAKAGNELSAASARAHPRRRRRPGRRREGGRQGKAHKTSRRHGGGTPTRSPSSLNKANPTCGTRRNEAMLHWHPSRSRRRSRCALQAVERGCAGLNAIVKQALGRVPDMLSAEGIIHQFPARFAA